MELIKNKKLKKTLNIVLDVLVALLIIIVAFLSYCNISGRIAYFGNGALVKIVSPSMEPTIPTDSYIYVKKVNPDNIKVNDVIVFKSHDPLIYGKMNTHRVIKINQNAGTVEFVTKGDNNLVADNYTVKKEDVSGIYVKNLWFVTDFANIFTNKWVFFIFVIIPAVLLIVTSVIDLVKKSKKVRMEMLVEKEVERLKAENSVKLSDNTDESKEDDKNV